MEKAMWPEAVACFVTENKISACVHCRLDPCTLGRDEKKQQCAFTATDSSRAHFKCISARCCLLLHTSLAETNQLTLVTSLVCSDSN